MFFTDDSERQLHGARACGMPAHHFTGIGPLRAALARHASAHNRPSTDTRPATQTPAGRRPFLAHQKIVQIVHGVVIRYRLSLKGPVVCVVHAELDPELPERSVRVTAGEHELLIHSAGWADRQNELAGHVQQWMMEHIDLRAAKPRKASRRYDEVWMTAWREANP